MMMKMEKFYNIPQLHEKFSHQKCNKHNKIEKMRGIILMFFINIFSEEL
jgi:hypothetical protein